MEPFIIQTALITGGGSLEEASKPKVIAYWVAKLLSYRPGDWPSAEPVDSTEQLDWNVKWL